MTQSFRLNPIIALIIGCYGCSEGPDAKRLHSFELIIENGIQVAETIGGPKYSGELYQYEKVMEIREDEDHPDSFMKGIVYPAYGPDGNYYFLDQEGNRLVVFNSDGSFSMVVGQQGEGPGDLMYPTDISFNGGMINIIQTIVSPRITRFELDGTLHDVITVRDWPRSQRTSRFDISGKGDILVIYFEIERGEQFESNNACVVVRTADGDNLANVSTPQIAVNEMVMIGSGRRSTPVSINYAGFPWIVYSEMQGIILSTGVKPELECYTLNGDLAKKIRLDIPPVPITAEDRRALEDDYNQVIARRMKTGDTGRDHFSVQQLVDIRDNAKFAEQKAYWRSIKVDEMGWFWLSYATQDIVDYEKPRESRFRILNANGEYIGDTTMPTAQRWRMSHDRLIVESENPDTGDRYWTVYQITSAIEGLDYP